MDTFLLSKHNGLYLLSEKLSQDPLENYFGKQRQRGGRNENPNIKQCMDNAAALRIQGSMTQYVAIVGRDFQRLMNGLSLKRVHKHLYQRERGSTNNIRTTCS